MLLVVGLGNPGQEYKHTRHNVGYVVVDQLQERFKGLWKRSKFSADTARIVIDGQKVLLVKPLTYMNNSGQAVKKLMDYYAVPSEDVYVFYDDVDVEVGKIRIRQKGGAGSHNGMRSMVQELQSKEFPRFRIGIGPQNPYIDMVDFVLGKFTKEEQVKVEKSIDSACDALVLSVEDGIEIAMSQFNR